jgi:serine/threonine protein kinase
MPDRVGQQLGNYQLVALLGQGGFAEAYLGQHVRLELQAAIKVLHTYLTDQEAAHFQQEAQSRRISSLRPQLRPLLPSWGCLSRPYSPVRRHPPPSLHARVKQQTRPWLARRKKQEELWKRFAF